MKKILCLSLVLFTSLFAFTGCNKSNDYTSPANVLASSFEELIKNEKDISKVADKLSKNDVFNINVVVEEKTKDDYLNGFDEKINNFDSAFVIQPMIGSIPFVAYVFESSNIEELKKELNTKSNPRWNICVEADETVIKVVDNYAFFVMSPKSFDE